jgi:hypothetical protein
MKPCWFFEVFENNQLEPACSFSFPFLFPKRIGIGGSFSWKYLENRNQPMIFFQKFKEPANHWLELPVPVTKN